MADTNEAAQRIKSHADSLASVPHNAQFRADLYALCEQATPPADAALIGKLRHQLAQVTEECAALRARPQAVAKDAARYVWLRDSPDSGEAIMLFKIGSPEHIAKAEKIIDAALLSAADTEVKNG